MHVYISPKLTYVQPVACIACIATAILSAQLQFAIASTVAILHCNRLANVQPKTCCSPPPPPPQLEIATTGYPLPMFPSLQWPHIHLQHLSTSFPATIPSPMPNCHMCSFYYLSGGQLRTDKHTHKHTHRPEEVGSYVTGLQSLLCQQHIHRRECMDKNIDVARTKPNDGQGCFVSKSTLGRRQPKAGIP